MKKILAIGGSNSSKSINKTFATYIANQVENAQVTVAEWSELELPLYNADLEASSGIPQNAHDFKKMIIDTDGIVISLAEHNGMPTAAFKNLWDWTSRIEMKLWADKPIFLASTSPGGRGGVSALNVIKNVMPFMGGNVITDFSFPSFYDNFKEGNVVNEELNQELSKKITSFQEAI